MSTDKPPAGLQIPISNAQNMQSKNIVRRGEGADYDYSQDHCFVKLTSDQTNGELCFVEDILKPGFYLGRHHHKRMFEVFYILEGEVEFIFDDESIIARPGDTVNVPPNVWHAAKSEKGARMLTFFKDGQFDRYLERPSQMSDADFADADRMEKLAHEFDIYEAPA